MLSNIFRFAACRKVVDESNKQNTEIWSKQLDRATVLGNVDDVKLLLQQQNCDLTLHSSRNTNYCALISAVRENKVEIMKLLLPSVPQQGSEGLKTVQCALMQSIESKQVECLKILLKHENIDINQFDQFNHTKTPLMVAASVGNMECFSVLLSQDKLKIDLINQESKSALDYAILGGHIECIQALLEKGAKTDNAMVTALNSGHIDVVEHFLNQGAIVDSFLKFGRLQMTGLMIAAHMGNTQYGRLLLKAGANAELKGGKIEGHGFSAMTFAVCRGHAEFVNLLLESGSVEVDERSDAGDTHLMHAAKHGHVECVRMLLNHGADAALICQCGKGAAGHTNSAIVKELLLGSLESSSAYVLK